MNTATVLVPAFETAMTEISHDLIEAIADHPGDAPARRLARQQVVADTMMSLEPQTPMETILAGHCLVFDHLILESAHQLLNCQEERIRLRIRPQVCASARMFLAELATFEKWHDRSMDRLAAEQRIETRLVQPARPAAVAQARSPEPARVAATAPDQRGQAAQPTIAANKLPAGAAEMSSPGARGPGASNPSPRPVPASTATQIRPGGPLAAERERAVILARPGQTAAAMNGELFALVHEAGLARERQRNSDALAAGGIRAEDAAETVPATATKVE
jgi:hypothetical protein